MRKRKVSTLGKRGRVNLGKEVSIITRRARAIFLEIPIVMLNLRWEEGNGGRIRTRRVWIEINNV